MPKSSRGGNRPPAWAKRRKKAPPPAKTPKEVLGEEYFEGEADKRLDPITEGYVTKKTDKARAEREAAKTSEMFNADETGEAHAIVVMGEEARTKLRSLAQRAMNLMDEADDLKGDLGEVMKEAKNGGFDVGVLRFVIKLIRKDKKNRDEAEALADLYLEVIEGDPVHAARRQARTAAQKSATAGASMGFAVPSGDDMLDEGDDD